LLQNKTTYLFAKLQLTSKRNSVTGVSLFTPFRNNTFGNFVILIIICPYLLLNKKLISLHTEKTKNIEEWIIILECSPSYMKLLPFWLTIKKKYNMKTAQNTTRKKKESFVVFEDWMKYSRFLNDAEFRQLMNNILNYYKGIEPVLNTSNLQEVWNDIIDDLSINVSKKQAKRDTMLRNSLSNPKLSIVPNTVPDIGPNIESDTTPNTNGMVDGRWVMLDGMMEEDERNDEMREDEPMVNVNEICRMLEINVTEWNSISPGKKRQYIESYNHIKNK
jgi:hypothetical protein